MAITQVAAYTPTDRRPQAFALSSPAALEISNQTTMRLVLFAGFGLRDGLEPGDHKIYVGLNTLASPLSWVFVAPDNFPDSAVLSGFLSITTYGAADPLPSVGSYQPGSFTVPTQTLADRSSGVVKTPQRLDLVRDFSAVGLGVTDDGPAVRAALDVLRIIGGGLLYAPTGVYQMTPTTTGGSTGAVIAGAIIGAGTTIHGDGPLATIFRMAPNAPNQSYVFHNYTVAGGDANIVLSDLMVDGNAANQAGTSDAQYGARFVRCRNVKTINCIFRDVYGTTDGSVLGPNGTAGEGFAQNFDNCADVGNYHCLAYATSPNTSTGFASNGCTNVTRVGCTSYGWGHAMGFTDWTSANIKHSGCHSYLNGGHGFNVELSVSAIYDGCQSGGVATSSGAYPFTNGQSLGNTRDGFAALGSDQVQLVGCNGSNNGSHGAATFSTPAGRLFVSGGVYANNGGFGISVDANQANRCVISGPVLITGNTSGAVQTGGTPASMAAITGLQTAPAVPATTVALNNPFHIPMIVNIIGGTVSAIALDGIALTGITSGQIRLGATDNITLTYTAAPTWQWFAAL